MRMLNGIANNGPCYQPCSKIKFDVRNTMDYPYEDHEGLFIQFDENVQIHKSNFVIDGITLMTRIGGIIGIGKEFLWVIVIVTGFIKLLISFSNCPLCINIENK